MELFIWLVVYAAIIAVPALIIYWLVSKLIDRWKSPPPRGE